MKKRDVIMDELAELDVAEEEALDEEIGFAIEFAFCDDVPSDADIARVKRELKQRQRRTPRPRIKE